MKVLVLAKHLSDVLGGIEIQCDLIATGLAVRGHHVTYVAIGQGAQAVNGVPYEVVRWNARDPEPFRELLSKVRPDVAYLRHNKVRFRMIVRTLHAAKVPVVFAASSLQDVQAWSFHRSQAALTPRRLASIAWQRVKNRWNWSAFRYVDGAVSLNPDYLPHLPVERRVHIPDAMDPTVEPFQWPRPYVAWVAALKEYKHPEKFVELARRCADLDVDFLMVGGLAHARFAWITRHEGTPPRFHHLGTLTPRQVNGFLAGSELMVHTCEPEGFGNNFIQAWQQGRPTLSLEFDPGGIIEGERLGAVPGTIEGLEHSLRRVLSDAAERARMGERAKAHSVRYTPDATVDAVESFLRGTLRARAS